MKKSLIYRRICIMKTNGIISRFPVVLMLCFMCLWKISATEVPTQQESIKVACILDGGFFRQEENGQLSGYSYEYLQLLAQYTGWDYEFVMIDEGSTNASLGKATDMMVTGEIDLMTTAYRNATSEEYFSFPDTHTGISRYCLMSLATNHKITQDNYFLQDELSIALVKYLAINDEFTAYFDLRDIAYRITYVETYEAALALLESGKVDTMLMTDTSFDSGKVSYLTTIERTPFYFVSDISNPELALELNEAIQTLNVVAPNTHQTLLDKYFGQIQTDQSIFSEEGKNAVAEYPHLTVGLIENLPPYQFYQEETVELQGITIDILEEISKMTGIVFDYVMVENEDELEEKVHNGELDICGTLPADFALAMKLAVVLSEPYVSSGTTWLTRANQETETAVYHFVSGNIPYYQVEDLSIAYDIEAAIMDLSKNGDTAIFCEPNVAKYYLSTLNLDNIEYVTLSNVSSDISLGMAKHLDADIMAVLNNALLALDPNLVADILLDNMSVNAEVTWESFIKKYQSELNILAVIVMFFIVFGLTMHSNKFKKLSRQDSMTKLFNSGHFHKYAGDITPKIQNGCLILIDIDLFKEVNDNHGHQKGDEVILIVAHFIKEHFREGDMVARLGGDEFAVLLETHCEQEELESKFQALLEKLSDNPTGIAVSLSIGGYIFHEPMKYNELYDLADKNLYEVKENGRNGFKFSAQGNP